VSEIIEALDGPIALTACVDGTTDQCDVEASCPIRGNWNTVNEAIKSALDRVTLADLLDPGEIFPLKPDGGLKLTDPNIFKMR
jgi:DNA-binding IscR family transcriptional regulator